MPTRHKHARTLSTLLLVLLAVATTPASATALFSSTAQGTLTLVAVDGDTPELVIQAFKFEGPASSAFGSASANSVATVNGESDNVLPGHVLTQFAQSGGSADPDGEGFANTFTDGVISIDNSLSPTPVTATFTFEYSLSAFTSVTNPLEEFAGAGAYVEVFAEALFGGAIVDILFDEAVSDSDFDDGLVERGNLVSFDVAVAPGAIVDLVAFVDSDGIALAVATVPTGSTLALFWLGLGLAGSMLQRRRSLGP